MLRSLLVVTLMGQTPTNNGWIAFHTYTTDSTCTTSYDSVSGALVRECYMAPYLGETPANERLVRESVDSVEKPEVRIRENRDPGYWVTQFIEDVGEEELTTNCLAREFVKSGTLPKECDREFLFFAAGSDGDSREFQLIACSESQVSRSLRRVRALARTDTVSVGEQDYGESREIDSTQLDSIRGMTISELFSTYGPPRTVRQEYPDKVALSYWVAKSPGGVANVILNRQLEIVGVSALCVEAKGKSNQTSGSSRRTASRNR